MARVAAFLACLLAWAEPALALRHPALLFATPIYAWCAWRADSRRHAAVAFALLAGVSWWEQAAIGLHHAKFGPGLYLLAAALVAGPARWDAAAGALGGCYTWAGLSKVLSGGLGWVDGSAIAVLVAERADGGFRGWLAAQPTLCALGGGAVLVLELAGVLLALPRTRPIYAGLAIAMHVSLAFALGYSYLPWILLDAALIARSR